MTIVLVCALLGALVGITLGYFMGKEFDRGLGALAALLAGFTYLVVGAVVGVLIHFIGKYW